MAAALDIIKALNIDSTLWMQLGIFFVAFFILKFIAIDPYFRAFQKRQGLTSGNQVKAEQIFTQTRELETLYQRKLRGLTAETKTIYDTARAEALKEQERIQAEAREKARAVVESARADIEQQSAKVRAELAAQAPAISRSISERLLPREVKP